MLRKLCQICESEPAEVSCQNCGKLMGQNCKRGTICKGCNP
ncbi:MAG: hypothetical protein Q8R18_01220 [bacterium]|nr:hypothetical protein [bacterium]